MNPVVTFLCSLSNEDAELRIRENKSKTTTPCSNLFLAPFLYFTFMTKDQEFCRFLQDIIKDFSAINSAFVVVPTCTIFRGIIHERVSTEKVGT